MLQSPDTLLTTATAHPDSAKAAHAHSKAEATEQNYAADHSNDIDLEGIPTVLNPYPTVVNPNTVQSAQNSDSTAFPAQAAQTQFATELKEGLIANRLGFFSSNQWAKDSQKSYFVGQSGDLVPYRLANDTLVTGTLLACLLLACFVIGRAMRPLALQIKSFFRFRGRNEDFSLQSEKSMNGGILVVLLESFVISLLFFSYAQYRLSDTFTTTSPYLMLLADIGICLVYFMVKTTCYKLVNWTFFSHEQRQQWLNGYKLVAFGKAITLLPLAMVVLYFNLPIRVCIVACLVVIATYEILIFYKSKQIFFTLSFGTFPALLYFCTLELLPLFFLWEMLVESSKYLAA